MEKLKYIPSIEDRVKAKAVKAYRWHIDRINKEIEYLNTTKYPMGSIIRTIKNTTMLEANLGLSQDEIGIIVGYDFKNKYYRVRYSEHNSYIGRREEYITLVTDEEISSIGRDGLNHINELKLYLNNLQTKISERVSLYF